MLKYLARTAGFLAYLLITLEMLFMVTPFALYYYSAYAPLLSAPSRFRATAWLPAFFLPHLSTEIIPSIGGLIFLGGLIGFTIGAVQVYYAKFRGRGVVTRGFYKHVRHPQYFFLAVAGLGLLLVWPRFILLVVYVHMLWFYYFLAHSEEQRMQLRYGDAYSGLVRNTSMFIPGEPGGRLGDMLFGWIPDRRRRLILIYCVSLVAIIAGAFGLREISLQLVTHTSLPGQKVAAVSLSSRNESQLGNWLQVARDNPDVQDRLKRQDAWVLVLVAERKRSIVHTMIDAGMTRGQANKLTVRDRIQLVFLRRIDAFSVSNPFVASARWQPAFIVETDGGNVTHVTDLDPSLFRGNPAMPIF